MNARILVGLIVLAEAVACRDAPSFEYDSRSIFLRRVATSPDDPGPGATLAKIVVGADLLPLLVDTGYPLSALRRGACPAVASDPGTYRGDIELVGEKEQGQAVRARFSGVTLFDLCPGAVGDGQEQPVGVLGGDLLSNFAMSFSLPRTEQKAATMTLFDSLPPGDSDLAADGYSVIHFSPRGGGATSTDSQASRPGLAASRVVLRTCGQPVAFSPEDSLQTCREGEMELKSSGANLLLVLSTGHGPLVLSATAWQRLSGEGASPQVGEPMLTSPLVKDPVPAHWVKVSRLALVDGEGRDSGDPWPGACAELARARRLEWATSHLDQPGTCFQPCDVSGSEPHPASAYLEIGSDLSAAVVSDTSDLMRGLNQDFPAAPQIDGIIGAGTLAGTSFVIDYVSQSARLVASCLPGADRQTCYGSARRVGLGGAPACPK